VWAKLFNVSALFTLWPEPDIRRYSYRVEALSVSAAEAVEISAGSGSSLEGEGEHRQSGLANRDERVFEACDCVIDLAAAFYNLPSKELRSAGRSTGEISRVRQIAMYTAHVVLGLSMSEVGKSFGRDRTTVMHACHLIEDLRDDEDFDKIIARTEHIVAAAFRGRLPL
jgi:hypothetical protein